MAVNSPLYQATKELIEAEKELEKSRGAEAKQLRKLKKETEGVKEEQKKLENSLKETVRSMDWSDLGKQLKSDLLSPLEGFLNNLPAPVKTLGMMAMKPFLKQDEEVPAGPGFRFDPEAGKDGKWKEFDEKTKTMMHSLSKGDTQEALDARALAAGASVEAHTLPKSEYDAAKAIEKAEASEAEEQTGLLESIKESLLTMVKSTKKPDASKMTEAALEKDSGVADVQGADKEDGGFLGGIGKTFKKIKAWIKKFITWKKMVVLLIGAIIGGLALKYWEPIKKIVLEIKDKIMGIYNTIKEWFVSLWDWGVAKGTDEDGEWSVTTFITNIWTDIKEWFEGLWTWASKGIAVGWTTVTNYIKGIWDTVSGWFTGLWEWSSDGIAKGWTNLTTYMTGIWNTVSEWFADLWSWTSEGIAKGWTNLTTYITGIWSSVKDWFTDIFSWGEDDEKETQGDFSFTTIIKDAFTGVKEWFEKLFSFDSTSETIKSIVNVVTFIPNMLISLIGKVSEWLLGLFGFDDAAKKLADANEFSIGDLVFKVVDQISEWFGKLFNIDIGAMFKEMLGKAGEIGSKLWNWLTGDDDEEEVVAETTATKSSGTKRSRVALPKSKKDKLLAVRAKLESELAEATFDRQRYGIEQDLFQVNKKLKALMPTEEPDMTLPLAGGAEIHAEKNPYGAENAGALKRGEEWAAHKDKYGLTDDDFSSWRREKHRDWRPQIGKTQPSTASMADTLYRAGPHGGGAGGNTSVVDASTSNMATSSSSNTNITVVNKTPVGASDGYTIKQGRFQRSRFSN